MSKLTEKISPFLWILKIIGGIALFIGILAFVYGFGIVEGLASLTILILGWLGFRTGNNSDEKDVGKYGAVLGIPFFALMGMALDQTGNFIYNQPLEWIFCPANSDLVRETIKGSAKGGGVTLNQGFTCVAQTGEIVRQLSMFDHLSFRFGQYLLIGFILFGLSRLYGKIKNG